MSQFFGGQFFGGDFLAGTSTSGNFFGGPYFNGDFYGSGGGTTGNYFNGPFYNGGYFGDFTPPPSSTETIIVDGKARDKTRREFEARQDALKADLRRIVEHAFNGRKEVAQTAPLAKPEKRKLAQSILAQTDFGPMQVSLAEIIRQIDEYQALLIVEAKRRDDEEAILMLMLSE